MPESLSGSVSGAVAHHSPIAAFAEGATEQLLAPGSRVTMRPAVVSLKAGDSRFSEKEASFSASGSVVLRRSTWGQLVYAVARTHLLASAAPPQVDGLSASV